MDCACREKQLPAKTQMYSRTAGDSLLPDDCDLQNMALPFGIRRGWTAQIVREDSAAHVRPCRALHSRNLFCCRLAAHRLQFRSDFYLPRPQPIQPAVEAFARDAGDVNDLHAGMDPPGILAGKFCFERNVGQQVNFGEEHQLGLEENGGIFERLVFALGTAERCKASPAPLPVHFLGNLCPRLTSITSSV